MSQASLIGKRGGVALAIDSLTHSLNNRIVTCFWRSALGLIQLKGHSSDKHDVRIKT